MKIVGTFTGRHGIRDTIIQRLVSRMGGKVTQGQSAPVPPDTDVYFSWRFNLCPKFEQCVKDGMVMVCIDLGYFDRDKYKRFSISMNGVHGNSVKVDSIKDLPERPHPRLKPWRPEGSIVQIQCAGRLTQEQTKKGQRAAASNLPDGWQDEAVEKATKAFPDKKIVLRQHPKTYPAGEVYSGKLKDSLTDLYATVTYGSNATIQTVIEGIPGIVDASRCVAYPVTSQDYTIIRPDREAWIHDLSYREYDMLDDKELDAAIEYIMRGYEQIRGSV